MLKDSYERVSRGDRNAMRSLNTTAIDIGTEDHPTNESSGGDGGPIVDPNSKGTSDKKSKKDKGTTDLTSLANLIKSNQEDPKKVNEKVIAIISDVKVLKAAYAAIKSKPGNITPGTTPETLDGIDSKYFESLSKDLQTGAYKFSPARRIIVPKANNPDKFRPLSMASPRSKIVQKAVAMVLEAIYEPTFSTNSHGFRPGKGVHSALKQVKKTFTSVN